MIIKKENATNKQFLGVDFVVLAIGEKSMITKMLYKTDDLYSIPANIEHSIEILEAGEVVDVFTPIREDYL